MVVQMLVFVAQARAGTLLHLALVLGEDTPVVTGVSSATVVVVTTVVASVLKHNWSPRQRIGGTRGYERVWH